MNNENFAVFILSHQRPKRVRTYNTLKRLGYTGKIIIVIDDKDTTKQEYLDRFGDEVVIFSKEGIGKTFDVGDNFKNDKCIVFARNVVFQIAKKMNIKYFLQLDDDYDTFVYKFNENYEYKERKIKNLDAIFKSFLNFYKSVPKLKSIAFAQNGDFIGGKKSNSAKIQLLRKCMNSFFCSTDPNREFQFLGKLNEDVNTYTYLGSLGALFFTNCHVSLNQGTTQRNAGGMTDIYLDNGTYVKSFYSVIFQPSSVVVAPMGDRHKRLHHRINWDCTTPKIISEELKKK